VRADIQQAQELGVNGVPFFVFDMRLGLSGAQPASTFTQALDQARTLALEDATLS
jgi:predicted DsbA family dithiol-disulfide isomerase